MAKPPFNKEDFPSLVGSGPEAGFEEEPIPAYVPLTAATLNLQEQLLVQYNRAAELLHVASYDKMVPLNQKATTINTAAGVLSALTKMQAELYSLERVKAIEACIIGVLKRFPDVQEQFLTEYEAALKDLEL